MTEPPINPYAAPESTADPAKAISPSNGSAGWIVVAVVFTLIRGFGLGFMTMIGWVHLSGIAIKWKNATPVLLAIVALCVFAHWVESRAGDRRKAMTLLAFAVYLAGFVISSLYGYTGSYPTPF
ncbi:MAG: hypothetical protein AAFU85_24620 [Planctomycetota bacterium]